MKQERNYTVGILLYDGVEILDMAGPAEVFAATEGFKVASIGITGSPVRAREVLTVLPDYSLESCPHLDILVVPGGKVEKVQEHVELLRWLQAQSIKTHLLMSVCKGAYILASAGLLEGKTYTTAAHAQDKLKRLVVQGKEARQVPFVDCGNIITAAGASAGIDAALHVVKRIRGSQAALEVAQYLEHSAWLHANEPDRGTIPRKIENTDWKGNK